MLEGGCDGGGAGLLGKLTRPTAVEEATIEVRTSPPGGGGSEGGGKGDERGGGLGGML